MNGNIETTPDTFAPDILELIEKCGEKFVALERHHRKLGINGEEWAVRYRIKKGHFGKEWGHTPYDALYTLLDKLN